MKPFAAFLSCCLTIFSLSAAEPPPAESDAGPLAEPILAPNQATVEVQVFAATRVPAIPPALNAADWTKQAATLRRRVLDEVALRGEARAWAAAPARFGKSGNWRERVQ